MGCIYRRVERHCITCHKRVDKKSTRSECEQAGHTIERRESPVYWIKYTRAGKSYAESSESERKSDAKTLLQEREGAIVQGKPVTPKMGRVTFEDAAADMLAEHKANGKHSYKTVERKIEKHLAAYFGGLRMANITTPAIRAYTLHRQTTNSVLVRKEHTVKHADGTAETVPEQRKPASTGQINRELGILKRMFSLAVQAGTLLHRPHIPMLKGGHVRTGFFEPEQYQSVLGHLPTEIRPIIQFAYITGWRIASEVLPLQWRHVDFDGGEVRLDAGTTKNGDGRVFPMTAGLRAMLKARLAEHERLKVAGQIVPWVFFREVAEGRGGDTKPQRIISFNKAWKSACRAAGCPGRIPHDLRRTAVRNFVRNGIPERVAMQMTGHKTRSVFERYNIVSDGDLRDAARRLDTISPTSVSADSRR